MEVDPKAEDIKSFILFTQATESTAIKFLKRHHNAQNAINAFYDPDSHMIESNSPWDESAFHSDRTQFGPENRPSNGFQVHSEDTLNPSLFDGTNPRPPSRVSNAGSTAAQPGISEDEQVQRALSISFNRNFSGQELGTTDAPANCLRPATQSYYEEKSWALTAPERSHEIFPNPSPDYRKREVGAPAFMKPMTEGNHIPPLLTILHTIPLAKEALLARDFLLPDYGCNPEWWNGDPMPRSRVLSINDQTDGMDWQDFLAETQRIMAFLELTERAYGNAGVLGNISMEEENYGRCTTESMFIIRWRQAVERAIPHYPLKDIFQVNCTNYNAATPTAEPEINAFYTIDFKVEAGDNLYDAMDRALWGAFSPDDSEEAFLEFGDVLIIQLEVGWRDMPKNSLEFGLDVPAVWFADRYLKENAGIAKQMRSDRAAFNTKLQNLNGLQSMLVNFQDPTNSRRTISTDQLLDVTKPFLDSISQNRLTTDPSFVTLSENSKPGDTPLSEVVEKLQDVAERVIQRCSELEVSKAQLLETMAELSTLYTQPSETSLNPPNHKFTLRGVSTDPSITYALINSQSANNLVETDPVDWQWWKLSFTSSDSLPVSSVKVDEASVLQAARAERSKMMLVYASDKAVNFQTQRLPDKLRNFVRTDNLQFANELQREEQKDLPGQHGSVTFSLEQGVDWVGSKRNDSISGLEQVGEFVRTDTIYQNEAKQQPPPYTQRHSPFQGTPHAAVIEEPDATRSLKQDDGSFSSTVHVDSAH